MSKFKDITITFVRKIGLEEEFKDYLKEYGEEWYEEKPFPPAKRVTLVPVDKSKGRPDLVRLLNSVGKKTFVEFFGDYSSEDYFQKIMADGTVKLKSAKIKSRCAIRIFSWHMEKDALIIIANSKRVEDWVSRKARKILIQNFKYYFN